VGKLEALLEACERGGVRVRTLGLRDELPGRESELLGVDGPVGAVDARERALVSNGRDESCGSRHGRRLGRRGTTTRMGLLVLFHHVKGERVCAFGLPFGSVRYSGD